MSEPIIRDLKYLYPPVLKAYLSFSDSLALQGIKVRPFETIRSSLRQKELQGTATKVKTSWHQVGLAVDVYPTDGKGNFMGGPNLTGWFLKPDNKTLSERGQAFGDAAIKAGFVWGGNWTTFRDYVHLEMTFKLKIATMADIFNHNGLSGVFAFIDDWRAGL